MVGDRLGAETVPLLRGHVGLDQIGLHAVDGLTSEEGDDVPAHHRAVVAHGRIAPLPHHPDVLDIALGRRRDRDTLIRRGRRLDRRGQLPQRTLRLPLGQTDGRTRFAAAAGLALDLSPSTQTFPYNWTALSCRCGRTATPFPPVDAEHRYAGVGLLSRPS